jgi:lipopolysaccharide transport system permease protein
VDINADSSIRNKRLLEITATNEEAVIEPSQGLISLHLGDLWHYRDLLYFLTWRNIKVRYTQTLLGVTWAIIQPLLTMVVFSVIFGALAKLPSENLPYPVFTYTALLPWQLFSFSLAQSSTSVVGDQSLITKIYFPRLILPLSSMLAGLVDFVFAFIVLLGMMVFYKVNITLHILALPVLIILAMVSALGVGLWLAALNVRYHDVRHAVPFLTQLWFYATPIAYSSSLIPEKWRWLYALNPMTGVVEGFRWALLGKVTYVGPMIAVSSLVMAVLFTGGLIYFKRMEDYFADVI